MAITDLKVSLRQKGTTGFSNEGYRLLPVTKPEYVEGLLDANGNIDLSWLPEGIISGFRFVGTVDASTQDLDDLASVLTGNEDGGKYWIVNVAGTIDCTETVAQWASYAMDVDDLGTEVDYPPDITLEIGDRIVVVDYIGGVFKFNVLPSVFQTASTSEAGIVQLYNGVDSDSDTMAATAAAVKAAYEHYYNPFTIAINSGSDTTIPGDGLGHIQVNSNDKTGLKIIEGSVPQGKTGITLDMSIDMEKLYKYTGTTPSVEYQNRGYLWIDTTGALGTDWVYTHADQGNTNNAEINLTGSDGLTEAQAKSFLVANYDPTSEPIGRTGSVYSGGGIPVTYYFVIE